MFKKYSKEVFLLILVSLLLISISAISAGDVSNTTTTSPTVTVEKQVSMSNVIKEDTTDNKVLSKNSENIQTKEKTDNKKTIKKETSNVDYYVCDNSGSDSNTGSQDNPFKTIGYAVGKVNSNDNYNIHIKNGTYKGTGNTNLTIDNNTPSAPLTQTKSVKKDDSNVVEITGANVRNYWSWDDDDPSSAEISDEILDANAGKTFLIDQKAFNILKRVNLIKFSGSITYVGKDNPTSYSTLWLNTDHGNNTKVANITFQYTDERQLFRGETTGGYYNATVENCTFNANVADFPENNLRLIEFTTGTEDSIDPVMIFKNSKINISAPANFLNFAQYFEGGWLGTVDPKVVPIRIGEEFTFARATNNRRIIFDSNNITISVSKDDGNSYATLNAIMFSSSHAQFTNNNINLSGEKYLYGMLCTSYSSHNNISNNTFQINGQRYTAGIYLTGGYLQNNTVANNTITLVSSNSSSSVAEDSGYPIVIEDRRYIGGNYPPAEYPSGGELINNTVINNTIVVSGNNVYGIEHYGGTNTLIKGNRINASGINPTGIVITGNGLSVEDNIIYITAQTNKTGTTADYFPAISGGIYAQLCFNNTIKNNKVVTVNGSGITAKQYRNLTIIGNKVNVTDEYAVVLTECNNNNVSGNELGSKSYYGDEAVSIVDGQNNSVHDNKGLPRDKTFLNVIISPDSLHVGDYIYVNITLTDEEGNLLSSKVTLNSSASVGKIISMNNGKGSDRLKILKFVDNATILVTYNGTIRYENCSAEVPFTILRTETILTINNPTDMLSTNVDITINGTLKDNNNKAISNANISVTFNNKEYNVTTNSDGLFNVTITTPSENGKYVLTARYNGTEIYDASQETITLTIGKIETTLTVNEAMDVVMVTRNMTINGTLKDIDNHAISDATIKIKVDDMDEVSVKTNENGEYSYSFKTTKISDHINVYVSYAGDDEYLETYANTWFIVEKIGSKISVDEIDNVDPNSEINITGKLSVDYNVNVGIPDATVHITIDGQTYTTTTDENGNYIKTITTPDASKTYTVSVEYKGSELYDECDDSINLYVKTKSTIDVETPIITVVNNNITIKGTLKDINGNPIRDVTIVMTIEDLINTTKTNSTGGYTFIYTATKVDNNIPVDIKFIGDNYYAPSSTQATLTVEKLNSTLIIDNIENVKINASVVITGKVTNNTNNPITDANVCVTVNNESKNVTTGTDGTFRVEFTAPSTAKTYTVTAKYEGSEIYNGSDNETTFDVEKIDSIITIDTIGSVDANSNVNVTGILVDSAQNAISNQEVTITVNNKKYTTTTGSDGKYVVTIMSPVVTGHYDVSASYAGSDVYTMASAQTSMFVKEETSITAEGPISATVNSTITITGSLMDASDNGIANATITVVFEGKDYTTTTNNDGKFTCDIMTTTVGDNIPVTVRYDGNDTYMASSEIISVDVEKLGSELTLNPVNNTNINSTVDVSGLLSEEYTQKAIANSTVTIIVDGISYNTVTDDNGNFKVTIKAAATTGTYTIKASYDGSDLYTPSSDETTFDVEKIGSKLTLKPVNNTSINSTVDVSGVLSEKYTQKAITNSTITIIVDGISYNTVTDDNGNFKVTIKAAATTGTYTIKASYDGSDLYTPSSDETTFDVEKISTKTTVDAVNGVIYEKVNLTAHITDVNGNNVTGGKVVFSINGVEVTDNNGNVIYANVTGGVATITKEAPRVWYKENTTIVATYLGNDAYDDSVSEKADVIITLRTANIDVLTNGTKVKVGDTTSIIAHVYYNNTLVNEGKVIFKLNGKTLKDDDGNIIFVKVENGVAKLDYTITSIYSAKEYTLTAVFSGKDYNRVATESHLTVLRTNTHIQAEMVNITSNNATVSLKIFDEKNNLINRDTKVTVKVNGKTVYNQIIVSNGVANLNLNLPVSSKPYNITIISGENSVYATSTTSFMFKNTVKIPTKVTATAKLVNNKTATVSVKINDNNNKPVTGNTKVVVKLNGKTQANAIAVNGVADIDMIPPTIKGTYTLVVMTGETSIYEKATTTTTLKI